jgi:hypothetical protein
MVRHIMTASDSDTNRGRLSQPAPVARAGHARANESDAPVRAVIDTHAKARLQNNEHGPHRSQPLQLRTAPRSTNLPATVVLKSP